MPRKEGYVQRVGPDGRWHQVKRGSKQYVGKDTHWRKNLKLVAGKRKWYAKKKAQARLVKAKSKAGVQL